ncbi:hypothetical protein NE237_014219 [Protea cynaroides]|uniref:Uncharacterized protein n=1 Tax=Protea cynaroides TaxID=273540 RepID=A0A9Q0GM47_9MAGN|nr:hypothetical protein NE237_014219 [Protea cynaroides]
MKGQVLWVIYEVVLKVVVCIAGYRMRLVLKVIVVMARQPGRWVLICNGWRLWKCIRLSLGEGGSWWLEQRSWKARCHGARLVKGITVGLHSRLGLAEMNRVCQGCCNGCGRVVQMVASGDNRKGPSTAEAVNDEIAQNLLNETPLVQVNGKLSTDINPDLGENPDPGDCDASKGENPGKGSGREVNGRKDDIPGKSLLQGLGPVRNFLVVQSCSSAGHSPYPKCHDPIVRPAAPSALYQPQSQPFVTDTNLNQPMCLNPKPHVLPPTCSLTPSAELDHPRPSPSTPCSGPNSAKPRHSSLGPNFPARDFGLPGSKHSYNRSHPLLPRPFLPPNRKNYHPITNEHLESLMAPPMELKDPDGSIFVAEAEEDSDSDEGLDESADDDEEEEVEARDMRKDRRKNLDGKKATVTRVVDSWEDLEDSLRDPEFFFQNEDWVLLLWVV